MLIKHRITDKKAHAEQLSGSGKGEKDKATNVKEEKKEKEKTLVNRKEGFVVR